MTKRTRIMTKQLGNGHEWRDLTKAEIKKVNNVDHRTDLPAPIPDLPSWFLTRVCDRCGIHAADFLDPDNFSCNEMLVQGIHES